MGKKSKVNPKGDQEAVAQWFDMLAAEVRAGRMCTQPPPEMSQTAVTVPYTLNDGLMHQGYTGQRDVEIRLRLRDPDE